MRGEERPCKDDAARGRERSLTCAVQTAQLEGEAKVVASSNVNRSTNIGKTTFNPGKAELTRNLFAEPIAAVSLHAVPLHHLCLSLVLNSQHHRSPGMLPRHLVDAFLAAGCLYSIRLEMTDDR